jgi:hypothetical protein
VTAQVAEYARLQFQLVTRDSDGTPRRAHLEAAASTGSQAARAELEAADAADPGPGRHLWDWFLELHAARGSNGFGPSAVGWQELDAWSRLTRRHPAAWEIAAIRELDRVYLEEASRADGERGKQRPGAAGATGGRSA